MDTSENQPGILYVVGTPIGNLEDITLRAIRTLKEVDLIAAEDTRVSRKLLSHFSIHTPATSFHEHSPHSQVERILSELHNGKDVALVSDAGMPGISDPGEALVIECIRQNIRIVPIPGPSAAVTALAVSGISTQSFLFIGFIPRQNAARRTFLAGLAQQPHTLVVYESPHRILESLQALQQALGNRQAVAAREITKVFEEVIRGSLEEIAAHLSENPPRGEFTLIIEGAKQEVNTHSSDEVPPTALSLAEVLIRNGVSLKEAAREIADATGASRRALYNALLKLKKM